MKDLKNYINENNQASITDLIYEANFFAEDEALADLEPKMQDVKKFKLLVTRWDKLGEEVPLRGDEHFAGNTFEKFEQFFEKDDEHPKERKAVRDAKNGFRAAWDAKDKGDNKEYVKVAIKAYGAYVDALYSWAKKYATQGKGKNKWIDTQFIVLTFLALGSWIVNYGFDEKVQDQLLGKLIKKFDKDMGKIKGVEGLSSFLKIYDEKKASMKMALDIEQKTLKSIEELKEERKKHKYTILGGFGEGQGNIFFFDNSKFESFEDIMNSKPIEQDHNDKIGCEYLKWTGYTENSLLRRVLTFKDKIPGCFLCSGYFTFDNKDKDNIIPKFGFTDEIPNKIYKYSEYDQKFFYRGKLRETDYGYSFFDSLWSQPKED